MSDRMITSSPEPEDWEGIEFDYDGRPFADDPEVLKSFFRQRRHDILLLHIQLFEELATAAAGPDDLAAIDAVSSAASKAVKARDIGTIESLAGFFREQLAQRVPLHVAYAVPAEAASPESKS